jgi:glycosyltransferase involved in cell wall biosynthesis
MRLAIDASNIRAGGGVTHLAELLRAAQPEQYGFDQVHVWAGLETLGQLVNRPWLHKVHAPMPDKSSLKRLYWQQFILDSLARGAACSMLFVPGGLYSGSFRPFTTMSRNLLPFDSREISRYGVSLATARLRILRRLQGMTFQRADGVIFLSEHAQDVVQQSLHRTLNNCAVIPHGVARTFRASPRPQNPMCSYSFDNPLRCLYVSSVTVYKHQWHVAKAIASLRQQGYPVVLELVGAVSTKQGRKLLEKTLQQIDPFGDFVYVRGPVPHNQLATYYRRADCFVFASTCETFGQVITEAMSSGLPIACSDKGPMKAVLGTLAAYFAAEDPESIANALKTLLDNPELRMSNAQRAYEKAAWYTWDRCAANTFAFLAKVAERD